MFHFSKGNATDDEDVGILIGYLQGKVGCLDGIFVLTNLELYACHFGIVGRFGTIEHYGVGDIVECLLIEVHLVFTLIFDIIGVFGGYLTSVYSLDFNSSTYIIKTIDFMKMNDVSSGLIKSIFFGFIIGSIGCYYGYNSSNGAEGVGKATTNAVVIASILIFIFNYLMTEIFFV